MATQNVLARKWKCWQG